MWRKCWDMKSGRIEKTAFLSYCLYSLLRLIISGILDIASFIASMSASLTSTSTVSFTWPFFSSDIEPPPYLFKPVRQVTKNVDGLVRVQVQVNLRSIMKFAEPFGSGFVIENQPLLFPLL